MIYMTSDNIVADFIQSNLDTIPYINYREIDLTSSNLVKALSEENALMYIQVLIDDRNDGLDNIVSNNGFHWKGMSLYYTTDNYVYSYNIFNMVSFMMLLFVEYKIVYHNFWYYYHEPFYIIFIGVLLFEIIYCSPIWSYFVPLYNKRLDLTQINRNVSSSFLASILKVFIIVQTLLVLFCLYLGG